jgi:hypothetical protein
MKPFSHILHRASVGYRNIDTMIQLPEVVWKVVGLWRMFLLLMEISPTKFTRPIDSFAMVLPSWFINVDASLTGLGFKFYRLVYDQPKNHNEWRAHRKVLTYVVGINTPYELGGESKFQNSMEFIAMILIGVILISKGVVRDQSYVVQGDSTSGLSWIAHEKFSGQFSQSAAMCYILTVIGTQVSVYETEHLPGEQMIWESDPLSRGIDPSTLYPPHLILNLTRNGALMEMVRMMDPSNAVDCHSSMTDYFNRFTQLSQVIGSTGGGWK